MTIADKRTAEPSVSRPTLLILSFSPIVTDARVLKQVTLFAPDYAVTTCGYGPAPDGVVAHVRIPDELVYWQYSRVLLMARQFRAAYWRNRVVAGLKQRLPRDTFDVVLADDVDTVPLARWLRPRQGVHADLHEFAPRMKEELPRWRLFVAPFMRWLCRKHVSRVASVTTVGAGIAGAYRREFAIEASVVTNASPYADLQPRPTADPIRLVHAGVARPDRFLELMIDAFDAVERPVTLDFYLNGTDDEYLSTLRARADRSPGVRIHPGVPYQELISTLNSYDVGVYILPPVNFNNAWALPNKFFDFVQARLALVFGPSPEMASIIERTGIGLVAEDFTAGGLARAISGLTPTSVDLFKSASHAAAHELSADVQVHEWARCVAAIATGTVDSGS